MSLRKMMVLVAATMFLLPVSRVIALESITCSDIEWSSSVTDKYPDIKDACCDVVESNGNVMAKIRVNLIDMNSDDISFRFVQSDGTLSGVYRIANSPDWAKSIRGVLLDSGGGSKVAGITMSGYVPTDRWAVLVAGKNGPNLAEETGPIEVRSSVAESEPTTEIEPVAEMPNAAGPLPLIGLLGAGFIALGGGIRLFHRRIR